MDRVIRRVVCDRAVSLSMQPPPSLSFPSNSSLSPLHPFPHPFLFLAARLINSLTEHRKPYELVLFPCERHSPHKITDRVYLEDR
jgi:hypothetical protein